PQHTRGAPDLNRIPRSSLFYFFLVAVLGIVFWFTWQQIESGSKGDPWSYTKLINQSQQGQVRSVDIKGSDAVVTEKNGNKHDVHLSDNTENLAAELVKDNVEVNYQPAGGGT